MKIQEMRSGLPHLRRKVAAVRHDNVFVARLAKEAFIESLTDFINSDEPHPVSCDIDRPAWAVVSFERVEARGLTYAEAARLMDELEKKRVAGLCIVTDAAASHIAH